MLTTTSAAVKPVTDSEKVTVKGIGEVVVGLLAVELMTTVGEVESIVKVFVLEAALAAEPET